CGALGLGEGAEVVGERAEVCGDRGGPSRSILSVTGECGYGSGERGGLGLDAAESANDAAHAVGVIAQLRRECGGTRGCGTRAGAQLGGAVGELYDTVSEFDLPVGELGGTIGGLPEAVREGAEAEVDVVEVLLGELLREHGRGGRGDAVADGVVDEARPL